MSVTVMGLVWATKLPPTQKLVLLAYADFADDDGRSIWPSIGRMAWKTGCSERTIQRTTRDLEAAGILRVVGKHRADGRYKETDVRVINLEKLVPQPPYNMGDKMTPDKNMGDKSDTDGVTNPQNMGDTVTPKPSSINHQYNHQTYVKVRTAYIGLFPLRPKPRESNATLQRQLKTRWKSKHFRENWQPALKRASKSSFVAKGSWFNLGWFLRNDDHYERCLNGNYDDRGTGDGQFQEPENVGLVKLTDDRYGGAF